MNRIPTEGLKHGITGRPALATRGLNEQNPDRGIETEKYWSNYCHHRSLNEQNPDRGIETLNIAQIFRVIAKLE